MSLGMENGAVDTDSADEKKRDVQQNVTSSFDLPEGPTKDLFLLPIPVHLRYHSDRPPAFGVWMNIWIGVAASFCTSD